MLYAPTWTPYSSLNAVGEDVIRGLSAAGYTVLVKLHDNSLDMAYEAPAGSTGLRDSAGCSKRRTRCSCVVETGHPG